jgi:hypothetical protein
VSKDGHIVSPVDTGIRRRSGNRDCTHPPEYQEHRAEGFSYALAVEVLVLSAVGYVDRRAGGRG